VTIRKLTDVQRNDTQAISVMRKFLLLKLQSIVLTKGIAMPVPPAHYPQLKASGNQCHQQFLATHDLLLMLARSAPNPIRRAHRETQNHKPDIHAGHSPRRPDCLSAADPKNRSYPTDSEAIWRCRNIGGGINRAIT
jgi:hypothetical protein